MIWENFKHLFHESWHTKVRPFIESENCDKIYSFLKSETRRGKQIAPLSNHVFRCFLETPLEDLKVVMMGMCPYHNFRNDLPVADGLLLGCSITQYAQPSLDQFYGAVEREIYNGLNLEIIKDPDVSYLAHQGVLMTNISLTTEKNKAGSHLELWEPFTKYFFEHMIFETGVPIIFLGKEAAKAERYVAPFSWVFKVSHPASASYSGTDWNSEGVFANVNKILKDRNGFHIEWGKILPF